MFTIAWKSWSISELESNSQIVALKTKWIYILAMDSMDVPVFQNCCAMRLQRFLLIQECLLVYISWFSGSYRQFNA